MEMNDIFKNISVPEVIVGMESKFYTLFNRYNKTGNLNVILYNFSENIEKNIFWKRIYGNSKFIVPASIIKLFSINFLLNIIETHNYFDKKIIIGNEINKQYLNKYLFRVGIKRGQSFTVKDLLELSLIPSSADAVYTLSRVVYNIFHDQHINVDWIKSKDDWIKMVIFVCNKLMFFYKSTLGIELNISDPTGIQKDLIKLSDIGVLINSLITNNSKILNVVNKDKTSIINSRVYNSTNAFIRKDKTYYHPKIKGLKTGSLSGWKNLILLYQLTPVNYVGILIAGCENHSATKEIASFLIKELDNKLFNISF